MTIYFFNLFKKLFVYFDIDQQKREQFAHFLAYCFVIIYLRVVGRQYLKLFHLSAYIYLGMVSLQRISEKNFFLKKLKIYLVWLMIVRVNEEDGLIPYPEPGATCCIVSKYNYWTKGGKFELCLHE